MINRDFTLIPLGVLDKISFFSMLEFIINIEVFIIKYIYYEKFNNYRIRKK